VVGPVRLTRAWYHCGQCGHGLAPRDEQLGVAGASLAPGLAEMIALADAEVSFASAPAVVPRNYSAASILARGSLD
jgi:hypothetical protein